MTVEATPTVSLEAWVREHEPERTIWLAGYPRAGAALIRTILVHCFGHATASIYDETQIGPEYEDAVSMVRMPISLDELAGMLQDQGALVIKTHQHASQDGEPNRTIVIVRDGRRMFESLRAFYRERNGLQYSMTELIEGRHLWGDWTAWIRSWHDRGRGDTLWLRYEDIMENVPWAVEQIGRHIHCEPTGYEIPAFETLRSHTPTIFRKASMTGNGGMTPAEEELFWLCHGSTMTMLGYHRV